MFGTYSVINIVVLLNLLIAMMNHSYQLISVRLFKSHFSLLIFFFFFFRNVRMLNGSLRDPNCGLVILKKGERRRHLLILYRRIKVFGILLDGPTGSFVVIQELPKRST